MDSFKKLNRYLKKYKWILLLGALFLTGSNFFLIWIPVLIRRTMDRIEQLGAERAGEFDSMMNILFSSEAGEILAYNSLLLVGTVLLYGILLFATRQTLIVSSRKIEFDIRNRVMDKLLVLPQRYFAANSSGEIYTRSTEDVARVREYFGPVLMYTINTFTRAGFIIGMMIIVNPTLTFWALLPLPFLSAFAYWVSGYINKYQVIIQEQYSRIAGKANEAFSSIRLIKAYNRQAYEQQKFEKESDDYRVKKLRLDLVESLFHPTLNLLIGLSVVIVVWKGGMMVIDDAITIGNIAEFVIYVAYLTWPVAALGYTVNTLQKSLASWERINNLLSEPIEIRDKEGSFAKPLSEIKGEIEFRNVSFKYPGSDEYAIKDLNMKITAGSNVAIVGRTGAGKTTLVNLIPRLFDPTEGEIRIDGVNIKEWRLRNLRKVIGYVPQETFLFSTTVKENIAFGAEDASMKQIEEAADSAQVLQNILDFEKKFETLVGERGITLSGGQKQRTAIARAIIKKPGIVIFDDSLSAVDTKTEDAILEHLRVELAHVTTVMISHRISTVKNADTIFYIQNGSIIESGTHDELIEVEGRYSDMYRKQLLEQELAQI
ncbi:ABC transporter ATP-binding protein [Rhodohalobacter sulfatireducens]|uniref:ABC transporter ATP-binding protein/permease n=1 Tax=Rhodohalobacter sulfatireducens TaxID=2911366 RepID=A0ABS9KB66_9BACT|nr:ABC transporter ATP-binding protein [Rhodohalobacter sulfatireducens]MCG2588088.1 ABC transporter ATP-binding protein/permease [Rhodohalobacter sulfatireducens]